MPDRTFGALLARAVVAIERDAPACAGALVVRLSAIPIAFSVDGDARVLRVDGGRVIVDANPDEAAPVRLTSTIGAVHALVDGHDELLAAVLANRVRVRAAPPTAARAFEIMAILVEGAARSSDAAALLDDLRSGAAKAAERNEHVGE